MKTQNKPFMVRLRPQTRALLDKAADDQRRSRSSIIDELIIDAFGRRYQDVNNRLQALLGPKT